MDTQSSTPTVDISDATPKAALTFQLQDETKPVIIHLPSITRHSLKYPAFDTGIDYEKAYFQAKQFNKTIVQELLQCAEQITELSDRTQELSNLFNRKTLEHQMQQQIQSSLEGESSMKAPPNICQLSESYSEIASESRHKKTRRCSTDIIKTFNCPYDSCQKVYGSEVSLNLHIRLKHGGGNKSERESLAKQMLMAQINGQEVPKVALNLPPGYFESYKENLTDLLKEQPSPPH